MIDFDDLPYLGRCCLHRHQAALLAAYYIYIKLHFSQHTRASQSLRSATFNDDLVTSEQSNKSCRQNSGCCNSSESELGYELTVITPTRLMNVYRRRHTLQQHQYSLCRHHQATRADSFQLGAQTLIRPSHAVSLSQPATSAWLHKLILSSCGRDSAVSSRPPATPQPCRSHFGSLRCFCLCSHRPPCAMRACTSHLHLTVLSLQSLLSKKFMDEQEETADMEGQFPPPVS